MKKYILLGLLVFSFVVTPVFAQQTPEEIKQTIQKLQQEIERLKGLLQEWQTDKPRPPVVCYNWARNLKKGDKGEDVRKLHEVLKMEGFAVAAEAEIFNDATEAAVIKVQEKYSQDILVPNDLVRGSGVVGSFTRNKLQKIYCGNNSMITVVSPNGGETLTQGKEYTVQWSTISRVNTPVLYSITDQAGNSVGSDANAQIWGGSTEVALIAEGSNERYHVATTANTSSYSWMVSTKVPEGAYRIKVCVANACDASDSYFKLMSGDPSNKPPVISEVDGPKTLDVNAAGKWVVKARDPEKGTLNYSVWWGDENIPVPLADGTTALRSTNVQQTATFTHTYAQAGFYYPTFTVTDEAGNAVKESVKVQVGEVARGGTAKVSVISTNGQTLTNAKVSMCRKNENSYGSNPPCLVQETMRGSAVFEGLPAGTYAVDAYADGYQRGNSIVTVYENRTVYTTIKLAPVSPGNRPPVITGVSAPTTLNVNQAGTFKVTAYDPENGSLTYAVDFGDRPAGVATDATSQLPIVEFKQTASFEHAYTAAGNYTVQFYVRDSAGNQTTSSVTVNVGNISGPSITIMSPSSGETWESPAYPGPYPHHDLRWSTSGIPNVNKLTIKLFNSQSQTVNSTIIGVDNSGYYPYVLSGAPTDWYSFELSANVNGKTILGKSASFYVLNTGPSQLLINQQQAYDLVIQQWGGCTPDTCGAVSVSVNHSYGQYNVVTAIYTGLRDDSTSAQSKVATATRQNGYWTLGTPTITWSCQPGHGHTDFSSIPCN